MPKNKFIYSWLLSFLFILNTRAVISIQAMTNQEAWTIAGTLEQKTRQTKTWCNPALIVSYQMNDLPVNIPFYSVNPSGGCKGTWIFRDRCENPMVELFFPYEGSGIDSDGDGIDNCFDYCPGIPNNDPGCKPPLDPSLTTKRDIGINKSPKFPQAPQCKLPQFKADPINIFNGNVFEQQTDIVFNSPFEGNFVFERYYNSLSDTSSGVGSKWSHNFDIKMNFNFRNTVQLIEIIDGTGRGIYFEDFDLDGIFKEVYSSDGTISRNASGTACLWKKNNGSIYEFELLNGLLISITDKNGNLRTLHRDSRLRLTSVKDHSSGRTLTFHYIGYGSTIDHITGPPTPAVSDGIWVKYTYAGSNLTKVEYADDDNGSPASGFEYLYEDSRNPSRLTAKKDLSGAILSAWEYNENGQAIKNVNHQGTGGTISYDSPNQIEVTDMYGITSIDHIEEIAGQKKITQTSNSNGCEACTGGVYKTEYDETTGLPTRREYFNGRTETYQDYDENNNLQTFIVSQGTSDEKIIKKSYHPTLSTPLIIFEKSLFADASNPDRYKVTIFDYDDPNGQSDTDTPNENPGSLIHRLIEQGFTLNPSGQVVPYEHITRMEYNNKGQVTLVDGPLPGSGDATLYTYNAVTGDLVSVTRPMIGTINFEYDAAGNITRSVDQNNIEIFITYDGQNRVMNTTMNGKPTSNTYTASGLIKTHTDRDGRTLDYDYNPQGLLSRITNPAGDYLSYVYSLNAKPIEESVYSSQGTRTFYKGYDYGDPANNATLAPGQPWKSIVRNQDNTANLETIYEYRHGNVTGITDPAGGRTEYAYDTLNRLTKKIEQLSGTQNAVTSFAYDTQNNLTRVTDANNHQTVFTYDDRGLLVRQVSPDTGTTVFAYDAADHLISKTMNDGRTTDYTYDVLGRLTSVMFDDGTQDIIYLYDENINGMGRLTGISDATGYSAFFYDAPGNLIRIEKNMDNTIFTTAYTYDGAGNITRITYPDGRVVAYEQDSSGNINKITTTKNGTTQVIAEAVSYKPFGPVQAMTFGNRKLLSTSFDLDYKPVNISLPDLLDLSYGYDPAGNITSIIDGLNTASNKTFSYDKAHRLTASTGNSGNFSYTYDRVGNRLTRTMDGKTQTYTYVNGTNRLSSLTGLPPVVNFSYDGNGNILTKGTRSFAYNQSNQLINARENTTDLGVYTYNSQGLRVKQTTAGGATLFHYDLNGNLIAESDSNGRVSKAYVYLGTQRLAVIESGQEQNVIILVRTHAGRALEGVKVYAFNENNSYTGIFAVTDKEGRAVFEKSLFTATTYKFRTDYLNDPFWSGSVLISSGGTTVEISEVSQPVRVIMNNQPKEGIAVYAFDESSRYLGLKSVTNAEGIVRFDLPAGQGYRFRADIMGSQFFSDIVTLSSPANEIVINSRGGVLNFKLTKGGGVLIPDIKTYLFSKTGQYLGQSKTTDSSGAASYEVPSGTYKIRCDYLGYQFWSSDIEATDSLSAFLEIPHKDVAIAVNKKYQSAIEPVQDVKAYLFTESGAYQGIVKTTDSLGHAIFNLPQKAYKIRADYLSQQHWSSVTTWTDRTITIAQGMASLNLTSQGSPLSNVKVYVFNSSGTYQGIFGTTSANGTASFILPAGSYKFRADWMGNSYWSALTLISADQDTPVPLSTGGGSVALTLKKDAGTVLTGVNCYLYSSSGSYLGQIQASDSSGRISFGLGDGNYKIRVDYMGYSFWTSQFTVPGESNLELLIPHKPVTIRVNKTYGSDSTPGEGIKTYLFTESGAYQGLFKTTDAGGSVIFDLPEKSYKVRADYLSNPYWSSATTWADQTITIEQGEANVEVRQNADLLPGITVYVFNDQGQYQNINSSTDANGLVIFKLPIGTYKFRADYLGSSYWATQSITAHVSAPVTIDTKGSAFTLAIEKQPGSPIANIKVYAFSSSGAYLGLNQTANETGTVSFDLPGGTYKFRADYLGYQFWTDLYTLPEASSAVLTLPHKDTVITVNRRYDTPEPLQGVKVYLFTESGAYQGVNGTTDLNGTVTFSLPDQAYKVRVDYLLKQYWSELFTHTDPAVTIDHAKANLHITLAGAGIPGAKVYLFNESGSYLSKSGNTDEQGKITFLLPATAYKFRIDYNGSQRWSDPFSLVVFQENAIELDLDLLAENLTANPDYERYDGIAPEKEKILLASTGSQIPYTDSGTEGQAVYYFMNDHLGTPLKMMNSQGQVVWSAKYEPFGKAGVTNNTIENRFRLPGQYFDSETGLHYNWHRYYDPDTGRYLTPDPIGLAGGIDPFVYVGNNPVNWVDPWGLRWQFSQSTGQWGYVNNQTGVQTPVGTGYSGTGTGRNNPNMQSVPNVGPIPQGTYHIGPGHYSPNTGPNTMNLDPRSGTDTFGRDLFRIHGNNAANDASEGCPIAPPDVRRQINNSDDRILEVIP